MRRRAGLIACAAVTAAFGGTATTVALTDGPADADATATPVLLTGQSLASGAALTSPDGRYVAEMTPSGAFVVSIVNPYKSPDALFSTGGDSPGATLSLPASGDLTVLDTSGNPVWGANVTGAGCANLVMQDDGNLVLYDAAGAFWSSGTQVHTMNEGDELLPGQVIYGSGGAYALTMNPDGALEVVDSAGVVWQSPTSVPGSYARMTVYGHLEVVAPSGTDEWSAPVTQAVTGAALDVLADGGIQVTAPDGTDEWSSGTDQTRTGLTRLNQSPALQPCPAATTTSTTAPPPPAPVTTTTTTTTATTATTTTPTKPVKLAGLKAEIDFGWSYHHDVTYLRTAHVRTFPRDATLRVTCSGKRGCPTVKIRTHGHVHTIHRALYAVRHGLPGLLAHLERLRFHAGDTITFTVSEPNHQTVRTETLIRYGRGPLARATS